MPKKYFSFLLLTILAFVALPDLHGQCPIPNDCTPGNASNPQANLFGCGILEVRIGSTFTNPTGGTAQGYQDYCSLGNIQIALGTPTSIYIKTGNNFSENLRVYLDANNDQTFTADELIFSSNNAKIHTGTIQIASGVTGLPIKLRVTSDAVVAAALPGPCTTPEYSQVEDYAVVLGANTSPPVADFSVSDTLTCSGQVNFTDLSINNPTVWLWNFGDGQTSAEQNPTHQYLQAGLYSVSLKVSSANGADSILKQNLVRYNDTLPRAAVCSPVTINQCCGYGISRFKLNTIDNSSGLGSYESFICSRRTVLLQGLSYPLEVSTNPNQNQDTKVWIDFNDNGIYEDAELVFQSLNSRNPAGAIVVPGDTSVKTNRPLRLRVMSEAAGSPFSFCTSLDKGQCEDYTVYILPNTNPPVASFTATAVNGFCQPQYQFTSTSTNSIFFHHWYFGDGTDTITLGNQVSHTYSALGSYDVKLVVAGPYGIDSITLANAVNYLGAPKAACAAPTQQGGPGFGNGIASVEFGSISRRSGSFQEGYKDFTCTDQTSALGGQLVSLTVRNSVAQNAKVGVWIDWNNSGTFETSEQVMLSQNDTVHTTIVLFPTTAVTDSTLRMRVVTLLQQAPQTPNSCGNIFGGQAEDYGVVVKANVTPPVVAFTADKPLSCSGIVQFTDQSENIPTSWFWDFGDGSSSTQQSPVHTYDTTGTYSVTLIATNAFGSDTLVKQNFVVVSQLTGMAPASCEPTAVSFCCQYGISKVVFAGINQTSGPATEGYRDFTCTTIGSAPIGSNQIITITNSGTSNENVGVWIDWNNDGTFAASEQVLVSNASTNHGGNIPIPGNAPAGIGLRMRVKSVAANQPLGQACDAMIYGQVEDYQLVLTGNNQAPETHFTASATISCQNTIQFTDTSFNAPTTWLWSFGDSTTSTERNPNHTYSNPGVYTVTLITGNAFGADTLTKQAFITIIDNKNLKPAPCQPQTTNLGNNPGAGIQRVSLNTLIRQSPTAPAETYSDNSCQYRTTLIVGTPYTLSVQTAGNFNENCRAWIDWNNNGTFDDATERILTGTNNSTFSVTINIPATAVKDTALRLRIMSDAAQGGPGGGTILPCNNLTVGQCEDYAVVILPNTNPPVAGFGTNTRLTCSGSVQFRDSSAFLPSSWFWQFGDGQTATQQNPLHQYTNPGIFTVKLRVSNAFGSDSIERTNYITVTGNSGPVAPSCVNTVSAPGATNGITLVQFGTLDVSSGLGQEEGGYLDKTCSDTGVVVITQPNQVETLTINTSSGQTRENCRVYIDYNNDGVFATTEQVLNTQNNIVHTANIALTPAQCLGVPVRMRVISDNRFNQINGPCYNPQAGQVEDYSIRLIWNYFNTNPPQANFVSSTNNTCSGFVQFTDSSSFEPTSWLWNFGDGSTSSTRNPLHFYAQSGVYTVKLIVSNAFGADSMVMPDMITITGSNGIVPATCRSTVQNPGQQNGTTSVRFGNMNAVNGFAAVDGGYVDYTCTDSALVVVNSVGQVDSLIVQTSGGNINENCRVYIDFNNDGIFATAERVLNTNNNKLHRVALTLTADRCLGIPVRMRVMTDNANNQLFNACSFIQAGQQEDYRVRLVWAAPAVQAPIAKISAAQTKTCNGVIQFRDSSRFQPESWLWSFGDGQTSNLKNPQHNYAASGNYTVKLMVSNSIGSDSVLIPNYVTVTGLTGIIPPACFPSVTAPSANSGTSRVRFGNLDKTSGLAGVDGGYLDYSCSDSAVVTVSGLQGITLTVNTSSSANNAENCKAFIDYNNNGTFESDEQVMNSLNNILHTTTVSPTPAQCLGIPVRMRIITDIRFNQIPNGCYNPAQGQAEDYAVRLISPTSITGPLLNSTGIVYPNPSGGAVSLKGFGTGEVIWNLTDLSGKNLLRGVETLKDGGTNFDFTSVPAGIYLLRTVSEGRQKINRINIIK